MRTARQALTDIAAWANDMDGSEPVFLDRLRAVLADVEPEPAVVLDCDAVRDVLAPFDVDEEALGALKRCVRPAPAATDAEYGWTAQEWREWSLKLSSLMGDEWDGDEDELSIIEEFVRHFSKQPRWTEDES